MTMLSDEDYKTAYRWAAPHDADLETYNEIFTEALFLIQHDQLILGSLLMMIINEWEKDRKSVPMPILSAALSFAYALKGSRS